MRLAIAICSGRDWKPQFGLSLAGLTWNIASNGINGKKLEQFDLISLSNCSNLCNGRQSVLDEAIRRDFTHLLFVDDDMTFPPDLLDHLAKHKVEVVATNAAMKGPANPGNSIGLDEEYLTGPGLQEVGRTGTGVMLLDLDAVKKVPAPHFELVYVPKLKRTVGEDYYFCIKLRKHGIRIFVDQDVSRHIGHVGDCEYRLSDEVFQKKT